MKISQSGRKGLMTTFLTGAIGALVWTSCSSIPSRRAANDFSSNLCDNRVNAPIEFIIHSYTKVPIGIHVRDVDEYLLHAKMQNSLIENNFIKLLSTKFIYGEKIKSGYYDELEDISIKSRVFYSGLAGRVGQGNRTLAWIGNNEFVTWDRSLFRKDERGILTLPDSREVRVDNHETQTHDHRFGFFGHGAYGRELPEQGLFMFQVSTGFNLGHFVNTHYFTIPVTERPSLCAKAGLSGDCIPDIALLWNAINNIRTSKEEVYINNKLREIKPALVANSSVAELCNDKYVATCSGDYLPSLSDNSGWFPTSYSKQPMIESTVSLELLMLNSIKVSKSINGDWISTRVTFDPTLMCKYGKPISDFTTH